MEVLKRTGVLEQPGSITTSFPPGIMENGKSLYEVAAEKLGVKINIENVGPNIEGRPPIYQITFPHGGLNEVVNAAHELAGGAEKFYQKFQSTKSR